VVVEKVALKKWSIIIIVIIIIRLLGSFTTVYCNIGFCRRPPPLSRLGAGAGGDTTWLCNV